VSGLDLLQQPWIFYHADSQRMSSIADRGEQRECREQLRTIR